MGPARVGGRSLEVARRARPGDIVVVDHADIDGESARALIAAGVAGLVDAAPAITGRYPTSGTTLLAEAGVVVLDAVGAEVLAAVPDGARVRLEHDSLWLGERRVARGRPVDASTAHALAQGSRLGLRTQLQAFSGAVAEVLDADADLLLETAGLARVDVWAGAEPADADVLVVGTGSDAPAELRALRRFVRDRQPAVIAVEGAVEVVRAAGLRAAAVVTATTPAEPSPADGARLVLVEPPGAEAGAADPDLARVRTRLGADEVAVLLALAGRARLVVLVGMPASLTELLDRDGAGPATLASTVLARLSAGGRLVHADALAAVYEPATTPARGVLTGVSTVLALVLGLAGGALPGSDLLARWQAGGATPGGASAGATADPSAGLAAPAGSADLAQRADELASTLTRSDAWAAGVGPALVAGRLAGHRVVVLALPGADAAAVGAATDAVRGAGAQLSGRVSVTERLLDVDRIDALDDLVSRLGAEASTPGGTSATAPVEAPERVAAALAQVLLTRSSAALGRPDDTATALLAGLAQLDAVTVEGEPDRRADLAVLVAGEGEASLAPVLADALAAAGTGVLVVGSDTAGGLVVTLRARPGSAPRLSTLDDLRAPAGPVTLVLALAELGAGGAGHYGAGAGAAAVPDLRSSTD